MIMERKSFELADLTGNLKISNISHFQKYLKEIWIDLISRYTKNENDKIKNNVRQDLVGITKLIFSKYYSLPGIIGDRLFRVFDSNNNGVLEFNEFKMGMITLFCQDYETTLRFIFDFYDFDGDGKISKEDIKVVLLYVSYSNENEDNNNENFNNNKGFDNNKNVVNNNETNKNKLNDILDICFENQLEKIDFPCFTNIVDKVNSDIYFMIYLFLLQKKPFSLKIIDLYNGLSHTTINSTGFEDYFSSSNYNIRSQINYNIKRHWKSISTLNNGHKNFSNQSMKGFGLLPSYPKYHDKFRNFNISDFNNNLYLDNNLFEQNIHKTIYEGPLSNELFDEIENGNFYFQIDENEDNNLDENIDKIKGNLESEKNNYEGYIYKFNNKKMIKLWFRLFYKDLFYYKNKNDSNHRGMHNLSGLFLKEEQKTLLNNKTFYSFSIIFPSKKRVYFCDNIEEYQNWIKYLRIATNYSNILEMYEIKEELGSGSFSIVKLAINKVTNQKVAVKIMNKEKMSSTLLESARTEIEIMKICQFPYIIKFIEAYENIDFIYIFMEYCSGGTLFNFLKNRNFKLKEELIAKIVYKICLTAYYFHSYGITHRDLKPENILMTDENDNADIRILDFGLGKIIGPNEKCSEPYGTIIFVAPEIILKKPYSKNVDSWSIGIITYIMLFTRLPFWSESKPELRKYIVKTQPSYKVITNRKISEESINFVQHLLIKDPNKRMTISQALSHSWFKKFIGNQMVPLNTLNNDKINVSILYNSLNFDRNYRDNNKDNITDIK